MKPKISVITLGVNNLQKSLSFYRDGLGFPVHNYEDGAGIVFFKLEGVWLALYPRKKLAEDAMVTSEGEGFKAITLAHNVESKEKVDEMFNRALSVGATAIKKPQDVFWGGYSGYFGDPDGNLWEVAWNPFIDLT